MPMKPCLPMLLLVALSPMSEAIGDDSDSAVIKSTYDVLSESTDIGEITLERSRVEYNNKTATKLATTADIRIVHFLGDYELTTRGVLVLDGAGVQHFDQKLSENGKHYHVTGERHDEELWVSAREVRTTAEQNQQALADAVVGVSVSLLSENQEDSTRISISEFDGVVDQLPMLLRQLTAGSKTQVLRLLDTATLEIESRAFDLVATDVIAAAGRDFHCRLIHGTSSAGEQRMWIAEDALGAFIVRETGTDQDGPYEIQLQSYVGGE